MDERLRRQAEQIFKRCLELETASRADFLSTACGSDVALREEVESLLVALDDSDNLVDRVHLQSASVLREHPPGRLGPYRIVEPLGHGGMGIVYRAEQDRPQRTVALKVIRDGFDSPGLKRRFELEAEVLGRLQHNGIAQIFAAGTAEHDGRPWPYFAMELVDGIPIQRYCAEHTLDRAARLELFARVCDAIQHAHQMGVIHRDLKPDNILVTPDGQPKVLDFGIARAIDRDLTATLAETDAGQLLGTVPYMSPEQAAGTRDAIDTRTDVYSLGVLLFLLITDELPHPLRGIPLPQALRTICEDPAPRARTRRGDVPGDLDTIIAKALAKDRGQRYSSAAALADDVRRYLDCRPIIARESSAMYQLRKFAARNRTLVGATLFALVALLGGATAAGYGFWQARQERDRAVAAREDAEQEATRAATVSRFLQDMLGAVQIDRADNRYDVTVAEMLDGAAPRIAAEFGDDPLVRATLLRTVAGSYLTLGSLDRAEALYKEGLALCLEAFGPDHIETLRARHWLGRLAHNRGDLADAEDMLRAVLDDRLRVLGPEHFDTLTSLRTIAMVRFARGDLDEAAELYEQARDALAAHRGPNHDEVLDCAVSLATIAQRRGRYDEAIAGYEDVLGRARPDDVTMRIDAENGLANTFTEIGRFAEAERMLRRIVPEREAFYGPTHPKTLHAVNNLAIVLSRTNQLAESEALHRRSLEGRRAELGDEHPDTLRGEHNLAALLSRRGKRDEARTHYEIALAGREQTLGRVHPATMQTVASLAMLNARTGRAAEAIALLEERLAEAEAHDEDAANLMFVRETLALMHKRARNYDRAEELYQRVLDDRRAAAGLDNETTIGVIFKLGRLYQDSKQPEPAEQHLRQAYELRRELHPPGDPRTGEAAHALATLYRTIERYDDALPLHRVKHDSDLLHKPGTSDAWSSLSNIAWTLEQAGRCEEALPIFIEAADGLAATLGTHWFTAINYVLAGECALELDRWDDAEQHLRDGLRLAEKAEHAGYTQRALRGLVRLYEATDRPADADELRPRLTPEP